MIKTVEQCIRHTRIDSYYVIECRTCNSSITYYYNNMENSFIDERCVDSFEQYRYESLEECLHDFFLFFEPSKDFIKDTCGTINIMIYNDKYSYEDMTEEYVDCDTEKILELDLSYFTKNIKEEK